MTNIYLILSISLLRLGFYLLSFSIKCLLLSVLGFYNLCFSVL